MSIVDSSLVSQTVKSLPAMEETWARSLGLKDPPEKEMATHSSILAWKIPWMEEPGRPQPMGSQWVGHNWATNTLTLKKAGISISDLGQSSVLNLMVQLCVDPVSGLLNINLFPLLQSGQLISGICLSNRKTYFGPHSVQSCSLLQDWYPPPSSVYMRFFVLRNRPTWV